MGALTNFQSVVEKIPVIGNLMTLPFEIMTSYTEMKT
jgi:hypothetical protein